MVVRFLERREREIPLSQRAVQQREVERGHVLAACTLQELIEKGARFLRAADRGERASQERDFVAVLPLRHGDGSLQGRDRLFELAGLLQGHAQRPERERRVRVEGHGLAKLRNRLLEPAGAQ